MTRKPRNKSSRFKEELHPRGPGGKFKSKPGSGAKSSGKRSSGSKFLHESGADYSTALVVKGKSKKFSGFKTVGDYIKAEPKGEGYALSVLKAYHKAGLVSFGEKAKSTSDTKTRSSGGSRSPSITKKQGKVTGAEGIKVLTKGKAGQKYEGYSTVKEFAEAHPKGKAYGLKFVAADLKSGHIELVDSGSTSSVKSSTSKVTSTVMTKPVKQMTGPELSSAVGVLQANSTKPAVSGQHKFEDWDKVNGVKPGGTSVDMKEMQRVRDRAGVDYNYTSSAVKSYTGSGYRKINGDLRAGKSPGSSAKELDKLIKASTFKEDTIMWRGVGSKGLVFNGAPPPATLTDKAFTSVSFNPNVASGFSDGKTVFRVRIPKGFPGLNIAMFTPKTSDEGLEGEAEVLMPRGTTFRVVARHKAAGPSSYMGHKMDVVDLEPVLPPGY